jgi:uncharacterized protein YggE
MICRAATLLATAAALAQPAAAAEVQVSVTGPVVELTVFESVEAEPDIARVSAGVTTQAPTAVQAMRDNAAAMDRVVERITQLGIAERDVQTSGISLGAQYDYDQVNQRQVFRGYQASNRVSVTLRQIDRAGPVLDALVAAGATDLGGPEWALDDDKAARAQARRTALETARTLAGEYAQAAGYSDLRLLEINETVASQPPMPMMRMVARDVAEAASTPVRPGTVQAGVNLTVKYEMTR